MQVCYCSPEILLASFLSQKDRASRLLLLTGDSGAGKTAWCRELIREAVSAGLSPQGIISPAFFESGIKTAIDLYIIHTGELRRLADRRNGSHHDQALDAPVTLDWLFDPLVLEWGNQHLSEIASGELLILDELGPLELKQNMGLTAGLALIDARRFRWMCVVVRPALLAVAESRWPWAETMDLTGWLGDSGRGEI